MKIGDIIIYNGIKFPEKRGELAKILKLSDDSNKIGEKHYVLEFFDGTIHTRCSDMVLTPTKYKSLFDRIKKKNPEIDPYDEDNWYENESKKYKRILEFNDYIKEIDPYGEDDWEKNDEMLQYYNSVKRYIDMDAKFYDNFPMSIIFHYDEIEYVIMNLKDKFIILYKNKKPLKNIVLNDSDWLNIRTAMKLL